MRRNGRWILPRSEPICVRFDDYRNRIGDLLFLPKSFNVSDGDLQYEKKREHYNGRTPLREV
jgi:hypothetical protein